MKFQIDSKKIYNKENVLLLPQENHQDLQNIISKKAEIENLFTKLQEDDNHYEILEIGLSQAVSILVVI